MAIDQSIIGSAAAEIMETLDGFADEDILEQVLIIAKVHVVEIDGDTNDGNGYATVVWRSSDPDYVHNLGLVEAVRSRMKN